MPRAATPPASRASTARRARTRPTIAAVLRDKTHGYTEAQLSAKDAGDLALFVTKGQGNLAKYVDAPTNKATGDGAKGEVYFNTLCAGCHGVDGKKVKDGPPLGSVADNGAEMMHKLLNGQPGEAMPALRALDHQIAADIAVHLTRLPRSEAARAGAPARCWRSAAVAAGVVFWGGFNTAMEATNTMAFCISCHEMQDNVYEEYMKSPHYQQRLGRARDLLGLPRAARMEPEAVAQDPGAPTSCSTTCAAPSTRRRSSRPSAPSWPSTCGRR